MNESQFGRWRRRRGRNREEAASAPSDPVIAAAEEAARLVSAVPGLSPEGRVVLGVCLLRGMIKPEVVASLASRNRRPAP